MKTKPTILYVDDEPINLMLFEAVFHTSYTIITADSGPKGLELLKNKLPVVAIVSDMKMPGMDGIQFAQHVHIDYPELPCFLFTGFGLSEEISNALDNRIIRGCFRKPINKEEIEKALTEAIKEPV